MVNYVDENGDAVDVNKILTIIVTVLITGSVGNDFYFLRNRQYMFEDTSDRLTYYLDCEEDTIQRMMSHYRVIIDEEDYYIPACFACVEGRLRPIFEQDYEKWRLRKADQPRDFIAEYKKVTGIDLEERNQVQHDGYEYWKQAQKEYKKKEKIPFNYEQYDPEHQVY